MATGRPFAGVDAAILAEDLSSAATGTPGQLAVSGGQIAQGYLDDEALTAQRFPTIDGKRWYLTGDLAYMDERGVFHHFGPHR